MFRYFEILSTFVLSCLSLIKRVCEHLRGVNRTLEREGVSIRYEEGKKDGIFSNSF